MKKAFTVAEVLITISIIVIITIMTLPGILKATKEKSDIIDLTKSSHSNCECFCK